MECPVKKGNSEPDPPQGECPVKHKYKSPVQYNVYGEVIDPKNMMPPANQSPWPGQKEALPVERVHSTIPKGGTDETWKYPSEQMFYNALMRKGKGGDVSEADMRMVVAIHNGMNEKSWREVMMWERMHKGFISILTRMLIVQIMREPDAASIPREA